VTLRAYDLPDGFDQTIHVPGGTGAAASFRVRRQGDVMLASSTDAPGEWTLALVEGRTVTGRGATEVSVTV
jgi:alpha-D-xyloside xylohydrolase